MDDLAGDNSIFAGSPRARALAELAPRLPPLLTDVAGESGADLPADWASLLKLVAWCLADGAIDAALLLLQGGNKRRAALLEVTDAPPAAPPPRAALTPLPPPVIATLYLRWRPTVWQSTHADLVAAGGGVLRAGRPAFPAGAPLVAAVAVDSIGLTLRLAENV